MNCPTPPLLAAMMGTPTNQCFVMITSASISLLVTIPDTPPSNARTVQAIQEAWPPFKDVPSKFLTKIIPTEQLPESTRLKEQFIATVVSPESQREGGISLQIDINPNNVINFDHFVVILTFTESNELKEFVKIIDQDRPDYSTVDGIIRTYTCYARFSPILPSIEDGLLEILSNLLKRAFPNGRPSHIQCCNSSSIVYKAMLPYRQHFKMEDLPLDFAKSQVCQEYGSLLSILEIYLWHLETAFTYKDRYLPLLKKCDAIMHNKIIKHTNVFVTEFATKLDRSQVGVRLLCIVQFVLSIHLANVLRYVQMRDLYPLDLVTQTGHISKIHELLDGMSTQIQSFLKKRRKRYLPVSNNFSICTTLWNQTRNMQPKTLYPYCNKCSCAPANSIQMVS
jgi:hypothetical protein